MSTEPTLTGSAGMACSPLCRDDDLRLDETGMVWVCGKCGAEFMDEHDPCSRCPRDDALDADCPECGGSGFKGHRLIPVA